MPAPGATLLHLALLSASSCLAMQECSISSCNSTSRAANARLLLFLQQVNPFCECGRGHLWRPPDNRIVGGFPTLPHAYPWMALLTRNGRQLCGASVISDRYLLSAAHCLTYDTLVSELSVVLGLHDQCQSDPRAYVVPVQRVLPHPAFQQQDFSADIMLLRLGRRLSFDALVRPICLPPYVSIPADARLAGRRATVLGWGRTSQVDYPSCLLREVSIPIVPRVFCSAKGRGQFCAGPLEGGLDACQGDSGGPLQMVSRFQRTFIVGVVSSGISCGLLPGYYTDVTRYLPWIVKTTSDSTFCRS